MNFDIAFADTDISVYCCVR